MPVENPAHRTGPRVPQVSTHGHDLPVPCDVVAHRADDGTVTLRLDASTAAVLMGAVRTAQTEREREARVQQSNPRARDGWGDTLAAQALRLATVWEAADATRATAPQPWMD